LFLLTNRKSTHLPGGTAHQPAINQLLRTNLVDRSALLVQEPEMTDPLELLEVHRCAPNDKPSSSIPALRSQLQQWLKIELLIMVDHSLDSRCVLNSWCEPPPATPLGWTHIYFK